MIYKKNPNFVPRKIADETILIPLQRRIDDIKSIFGLNPVASSFWDMLDGQKNISEIKKALLNEYQVEESALTSDIDELINQLKEIQAIESVS